MLPGRDAKKKNSVHSPKPLCGKISPELLILSVGILRGARGNPGSDGRRLVARSSLNNSDSSETNGGCNILDLPNCQNQYRPHSNVTE